MKIMHHLGALQINWNLKHLLQPFIYMLLHGFQLASLKFAINKC